MSITANKKAFHEYFVEEKYEAGIVLEGWEVKAIRDNRVNIKEAYVIIQRGEIYLIGCHVTPLGVASTHVRPDAIRTRKLLLHNEEIAKLIGKVERAGYAGPIEVEIVAGIHAEAERMRELGGCDEAREAGAWRAAKCARFTASGD